MRVSLFFATGLLLMPPHAVEAPPEPSLFVLSVRVQASKGASLAPPAEILEGRSATLGFGFGFTADGVAEDAPVTFGFGLELLTAGVAGCIDGVIISSLIDIIVQKNRISNTEFFQNRLPGMKPDVSIRKIADMHHSAHHKAVPAIHGEPPKGVMSAMKPPHKASN